MVIWGCRRTEFWSCEKEEKLTCQAHKFKKNNLEGQWSETSTIVILGDKILILLCFALVMIYAKLYQ